MLAGAAGQPAGRQCGGLARGVGVAALAQGQFRAQHAQAFLVARGGQIRLVARVDARQQFVQFAQPAAGKQDARAHQRQHALQQRIALGRAERPGAVAAGQRGVVLQLVELHVLQADQRAFSGRIAPEKVSNWRAACS